MVWEERWHPLREEWVIIAAHRQDRPWSGEKIGAADVELPEYDPACYLCPGNGRVSGQTNPDYHQTFVFDNDLPCVGMQAPAEPKSLSNVFRVRPARGIARVVCYSPLHHLTLAELSPEQIDQLLVVLSEQFLDLGKRDEINHVLMFENKGDAVGTSNPHPHGQIYATNFVFKTIENEARACNRYWQENRRVLFQDIIAAEQADGRRILAENDAAIAFLPYFARYAYEVFVAPKARHGSIAGLNSRERQDLARVLKTVLIRFDNLWKMPFPYVMALHQEPTDGQDYAGFHFHIEFHPPLRKPNLRKYLAGPEIGGGSFLSDTCPEEKAAELLALPAVHYKQTGE